MKSKCKFQYDFTQCKFVLCKKSHYLLLFFLNFGRNSWDHMDDKCAKSNLWAIKCSPVWIFFLLCDGKKALHVLMVIVSFLIDPCCVVNLFVCTHPLSFYKLSIKVAIKCTIVSIPSPQSIRASPVSAPDAEYDRFDCLMTVPRWWLQTWPEHRSTDSRHY